MTAIVDRLPPVTEAQRASISSAPRTVAAHTDLLASVPAMQAVERGGTASEAGLPAQFVAAAWNVERCLFPAETAAHLLPHGPAVVLLSEVDCGMARTAQRHTTAEMAAALGMEYAYAVEFYEMDLGGETERPFCTDDHNALGWHGNAILSRVAFQDLALIRLDPNGHWFATEGGGAGDPSQPRLGGRMAVAAVVPTAAGPICVVSTHLESNADAAHRHQEFARLLDGVEAFAPGLPVLIGGDLNTGNHMPPDYDWRVETLFALAEARGYHWDLTADGTTTRPSLITPHPTRRFKLDWFCARGIAGWPRPILSSVGEDGRPLSDHDCMLCEVDLTPNG